MNLGTLTLVCVVPLSEQYLTYCPCFLFSAVNSFWVGKNSVSISSCKFYPYFTPLTNRIRLYEGIFQQEPAIAKLDRLFTPIRRSSEYMSITPVQTSIPLSGDFILSTNRSPSFRSYPHDYRPFRLAFAPVTLQSRLASPCKKIPWPVLRNVRYNTYYDERNKMQ